ncbi:UNVERIFIED_CONTAM: hypothetical protein HDU68_005053 [Siphonaria sp. JEL0065]|nr:hypothetical protein HDU68_005053 [Siphonaria sp. JEL0065]
MSDTKDQKSKRRTSHHAHFEDETLDDHSSHATQQHNEDESHHHHHHHHHIDPDEFHSLKTISFDANEHNHVPHVGRHFVNPTMETSLLSMMAGDGDEVIDEHDSTAVDSAQKQHPRRASLTLRPIGPGTQPFVGRASTVTGRSSRTSQATRPTPPPQQIDQQGNPATEITIERAVYYDTIIDAVAQGLDETKAIDLGQKARARAKEIHDKARQRITEEHERIAREYMERERERERQEEAQRKKLETEQMLQQQQQQQQIAPEYAINSDRLSVTIENATPRWPDEIHSESHPHTISD